MAVNGIVLVRLVNIASDEPADRASGHDIGGIVLQRRPSRGAYGVAALFSLAWGVLVVGLAWSYFGADFTALFSRGRVKSVRCEYVLNHIVALILLDRS